MVNFVIKNDSKANIKFAPLQSNTGQTLRIQYSIDPKADTLVFIEKNKAYTYARAAIRVCKYLDWPAKMLYAFIIIPSFISNSIYKWIAKNRYKWFGKKETCMIPNEDIKFRFLE